MTRIIKGAIFAVMASSILGSLWINVAGFGMQENFLGEEAGQIVFLYLLTTFYALVLEGVFMVLIGIPAAMLSLKLSRSPFVGLAILGAAAWFAASLVESFLSPLFIGLNGWVTAPYAVIAAFVLWVVIYDVSSIDDPKGRSIS